MGEGVTYKRKTTSPLKLFQLAKSVVQFFQTKFWCKFLDNTAGVYIFFKSRSAHITQYSYITDLLFEGICFIFQICLSLLPGTEQGLKDLREQPLPNILKNL